MAEIRFYVFSTMFLVLIGSLPCSSKICSTFTIRECSKRPFKQNYCTFFKSVKTCLEELKPFCKTDQLKMNIEQSVVHHDALSTQCPGMTATCFIDAQAHCMRNVPYNVRYVKDYSIENKKRECQTFEGKDKEAQDCLKTILSQCTSQRVKYIVDKDLKIIAAINDVCANLD